MHADAQPLTAEPVDAHTHHAVPRTPQPYSHPYLAGFGLGLVLLASFVIMGRGIGASGAFSSLVAFGADAIAPEHTRANAFYAEYLGDGTRHPLMDWLVFEVVGLFAGGFLSGILAGRVRVGIERGPSTTNRMRLMYAFAGGGLMGIGAKLARGCTSGQALTGGALLNVGSWAFMMCVFAGAYAVAYFVRRQWQ